MAKKFRTITDPDRVIVNKNTGEIEDLLTKKVCETPEEFIKLYLTSINDLITLDSRLMQILLVCVKRSTFSDSKGCEGNIFHNDYFFKQTCKSIIGEDLTDNAINVYVSRLAKQNIIIRYCRGGFILNPKYFFKGTIAKKSRLQLVATYEGK